MLAPIQHLAILDALLGSVLVRAPEDAARRLVSHHKMEALATGPPSRHHCAGFLNEQLVLFVEEFVQGIEILVIRESLVRPYRVVLIPSLRPLAHPNQ